MTEITAEENMWFPGPDALYKGREGVYAQSISDFSGEDLTNLIQRRAHEDAEWAVANGLVGHQEDLMHKMVDWVSRDVNIIQCVIHIKEMDGEQVESIRSVDWMCRHLANAAKKIAEGVRD